MNPTIIPKNGLTNGIQQFLLKAENKTCPNR